MLVGGRCYYYAMIRYCCCWWCWCSLPLWLWPWSLLCSGGRGCACGGEADGIVPSSYIYI